MDALIVEDGSGLSDANTYGEPADVDERARITLTAPGKRWLQIERSDIKQAACLRSAQLLGHLPWRGSRVSSTQALSWPRFGTYGHDPILGVGVYGGDSVLYASNVVPAPVVDAWADLAIILATTDQLGLVDRGAVQSITLGQTSISYASGVSPSFIPSSVCLGIEHFLDRTHYLFRV